jgi:hypothetical protein
MKLNESNHETSEQVYVCPYCLQDVRKYSTCACMVEGDPDDLPAKARIERLTENNRQKILMIVQLLEDRESKRKEVESKDIAHQTTPPAMNSLRAVANDSLSDDEWIEMFVRLKYGISRLVMYEMIDDVACAIIATRERIKSDYKTNDPLTVGMIICIQSKLQELYDEMEDNYKEILNAFNSCFPNSNISG